MKSFLTKTCVLENWYNHKITDFLVIISSPDRFVFTKMRQHRAKRCSKIRFSVHLCRYSQVVQQILQVQGNQSHHARPRSGQLEVTYGNQDIHNQVP